ncbi:MAG: ABC transporter substrate-binding protein [Methanoregulaceae archaeon]|nr:ABC transporter substrate-binding protein [Methanoregulaceae archaeon]
MECPAARFLLCLILLSAVLFAGCTTGKSPGMETPQGEDVVDAFLPITGVASQFGESHKAALCVAMDDINAYYRDTGSKYRIRVAFYDTGTDPATSLALAKQVHADGRRFIIGYVTSAEIQAMKEYTDANGMIVITTGSTAPSLAIPGDSVYRVVSDDTSQGRVLASWFSREKISAVVPLWRGDTWGDGLVNATRDSLPDHGGAMSDGVRYDPGITDFNETIATLDAIVGRAIGMHGADRTGVFVVSFGEIVPVMTGAASYPNLSRVRWFGCDGNAGDPGLTGTTPAARFAAKTGFAGTAWGIPPVNADSPVIARIRDRLGRDPDGMAIALYDVLWVVASVNERMPAGAGPDRIEGTLMEHMKTYDGVSSSLALNAAGDRELASYDILRVGTGPDGSRWEKIANVVSRPDGREEVFPLT